MPQPLGSRKARAPARAFFVRGLVAITALSTAACTSAPADAAWDRSAQAVPYAPAAPIDARVPGIELRAALELRGRVGAFGGISALLVDGPDLLLMGDRGALFRGHRMVADDGRLLGFDHWGYTRLRIGSPPAAPDSEGLTRAADGGLTISAEGADHLLELHGSELQRAVALPPNLASLAPNEGVEALATMPDAALLAIGEAGVAEGRYPVSLIAPDRTIALTLASDDGYRPTGADVAGGWLIVIERRVSLFGGLGGRLVALPVDAVAASAGPLRPITLAVLDGESWSENWEGVAVERAGDALDIYLISDDNFSALQRTLLLQLRWTPPTA